MFKNFISILLITLLISGFLSGCYDAIEIDNEVYAISIGIDKGVSNKLRLTVQYPTYKGESGGGNGGQGSGGEAQNAQGESNVHTIEAPTILEGLDMLSMAISRRVSMIHTKWIIFSEDFARLGISGYLGALERFRETRTTMSVLISRGKAEDFIKENKSNIGSSLSKSIELFLAQSNFSGFFPRVTLFEFYRKAQSTYRQPVVLYGGINDFNVLQDEEIEEPPLVTGKGFLPGELPRSGVAKRELAGIAVFDGSKMVGSLNSYETTFYMMLTGDFKSGKVSIPDRKCPQHAIVFDLHNNRKPKVKAYFKDGKPVIDINVVLDSEVYAIQSRINYETLSMAQDLENQIEEFILKGMKEIIKKTQEELGTDIFGFGYWMAGNFFTIQEWEEFNWLSHYKDAIINLDLEVIVRRTGLRFNSAPLYNTKGKEEGETND